MTPFLIEIGAAASTFAHHIFESELTKIVLAFGAGRVFQPAKQKYRMWRRRTKDLAISMALEHKSFVVGNMHEPVYLADIAITGYLPENLVCEHRRSNRPDVRQHHEGSARDSEKYWRRLIQDGKITNNINFALTRFSESRPGSDELQKLTLSVVTMPYIDTRIAGDIWTRSLTALERDEVIRNGRHQVNPMFSRFFGTTLVVVVDGEDARNLPRMLLLRRSPQLSVSPGWYTFGMGETMCELDVPRGTKDPNAYYMARRALKEELGVILPDRELGRISLFALALDEVVYEWQLFGWVDLRVKPRLDDGSQDDWEPITLASIKAGVSNGRAKDKYEHESISSIEFSPNSIVKTLAEIPIFHTYKVCSYLALIADGHDRDEVDKAFSKRSFPDWQTYQINELPRRKPS